MQTTKVCHMGKQCIPDFLSFSPAPELGFEAMISCVPKHHTLLSFNLPTVQYYHSGNCTCLAVLKLNVLEIFKGTKYQLDEVQVLIFLLGHSFIEQSVMVHCQFHHADRLKFVVPSDSVGSDVG